MTEALIEKHDRKKQQEEILNDTAMLTSPGATVLLM